MCQPYGLVLGRFHSLNPEGLNVYRTGACSKGATPSGVESISIISSSYNHAMPPASICQAA
ncbi:MAG: hypothetical protein JXA77_14610 [Bacteroidales bacterium]|nr:hypothetical protein [Bacteroidales bacterium]